MTRNSRSGYLGFRDRLEQVFEDLGGDRFALFHAREMFSASLQKVVNLDSHVGITDNTNGAHISKTEWLRATPEQFDRAADQATESCSLSRYHESPFETTEADGFTFGWNRHEIVRLTDRAVLVLVTATKWGPYAEASKAGYELLCAKKRAWRSTTRQFRSTSARDKAMTRLAADFYSPRSQEGTDQ